MTKMMLYRISILRDATASHLPEVLVSNLLEQSVLPTWSKARARTARCVHHCFGLRPCIFQQVVLPLTAGPDLPHRLS